MSTTIEVYEDPIISLANDPNLNKEVEKTNQLISLISGFTLAERKVSKLCQLSLTILQTLEKIELTLKNWAFLSLDINSGDHFNSDNTSIKQFNNSISMKVLTDCNELNKRLSKISIDLDYITKASKTLTPIEYILDSGTLLTSLTLRNIKLKYELTDKVTVSYLKAILITIGTELETMLTDDTSDATVTTYKSFVASLLKQLNTAIEDEDMTEKHECLAVINDMEKMFEAFKLERAKDVTPEFDSDYEDMDSKDTLSPLEDFHIEGPSTHKHHHHELKSPSIMHSDTFSPHSEEDSDSVYGSDMGSSMYGSYSAPLIHSITKSSPQQPKNSKLSDLSGSDSLFGSSMLHKTTISQEMPYLMSAFNLAKNVEEDIRSYSAVDDDKKAKERSKPHISTSNDRGKHTPRYPQHHNNLKETALTSESTVLHEPPKPSPYSYLYANNSLLSRLGIRPQVITTDAPIQQPSKGLGLNTTTNIRGYEPGPIKQLKAVEKTDDPERDETDGKENAVIPLTQKNLATHTFSSLNVTNDFNDHVE